MTAADKSPEMTTDKQQLGASPTRGGMMGWVRRSFSGELPFQDGGSYQHGQKLPLKPPKGGMPVYKARETYKPREPMFPNDGRRGSKDNTLHVTVSRESDQGVNLEVVDEATGEPAPRQERRGSLFARRGSRDAAK